MEVKLIKNHIILITIKELIHMIYLNQEMTKKELMCLIQEQIKREVIRTMMEIQIYMM